jgi:hypothetical protein
MNTSATVTFLGINLSNPAVYADFADTGAFTRCDPPVCGIMGYNSTAGIFIFNVTHFTNYTAEEETAPTPPVLVYPPMGGTDFNRSINFVWQNSTDAEGDALTYHLELSTDSSFGSLVLNVTLPQQSASTTNYTNPDPLDLDTLLFWRVYASDGLLEGNYSDVSNFTVPSLLAFSLPIDRVSFGNLTQGVSVNTTAGNATPFVLRNIGNMPANVTITGTRLYQHGAYPSNAYQFFVTDNATGSFDLIGSTTSWTDMTNVSSRIDVLLLDWNASHSQALVHIKLTPPLDEPAGNKTSTVTMSAG